MTTFVRRAACGAFVLLAACLFSLSQSSSLCAGTEEEPKSTDSARPAASGPSIDEMLLFFPTKFPDGDWQPKQLKFQDVDFKSADETRLHGWYCPCDKPRAVVLITHGNGGNVAHRVSWLTKLQRDLRVATLLFDYRGYGKSDGVPTVDGVLADARAARTKLAELAGVKEEEIVLMGESLGGAIAVQLASEKPARALILQCTFSSLKDVAQVHYPGLAWLVPPQKLDSVTAIAKYKGPLLQSHGTADQVIPFASAAKLFKAANQPKDFVAIQGANHNEWITAEYFRQLDQFIGKL